MNRNITKGVLAALLCILCCYPGMADTQDGVNPDISAHPVQFIKNAGQAHEDILYQVKSAEFSFDFTHDSLLVNGPIEDCEECDQAVSSPIIVTVAGTDSNVSVEAFDQLEGYANFLIGQNETDWQKYVPWYGGIRYVNILPGINLTYSGKQGVLKREFIVNKEVDPSIIKLVYQGSDGLSITDDGSLQVSTSFGNLTERAPYSYQKINGTTVQVESSYQLFENGEVGYALGDYDPAYPLVIDPYLEYSTLLGGSLEDYGMDIARDSDGDVYVTGYTSSCNFPVYKPLITTSPKKFNGSYCHNSRDIFVTKISVDSATGNATIAFSTYLGGTKADFGRGIEVDSLKNMYVTGDTFSEDFPTVFPFSYGNQLHGSNDAFVIKIRADGANIWWSDYIGGNFADQANDIALDSLNAVYLTGQTVGNSPYKKLEQVFPTTPSAYQTAPNPDAVMGDAFAVKISPDGKRLEYSTYISGSGQDYGNGITVDGKGMAYIVGTTSSTNLIPATAPGYQKSIKGGQDAFLFKLNFQAGVQPVYATYLGGSTGYDYGEAVTVDSSESAYVTGATASTDFPVTNMALQTVKGWQYDAFEKDAYVTKFSTDGRGLIYSTYLGGSMDDWGYDIKVDDKRRAFVTGYSRSTSIPRDSLVNPIKYASGGQDGFLTIIKEDGRSAEFSTLFGGYRDEVGRGVAIEPNGNTSFVTGYTSSPTINNLICGDDCENDAFPVYKWINQTVQGGRYIGGNFTGNYQGSFDAFVMKFGQPSIRPSFNVSTLCGPVDPSTKNLTVTFNDTTIGSGNVVNRIWHFGDQSSHDAGTQPAYNLKHNYTSPGQYDATLTIYTYTDMLVSDPKRITVCQPSMSDNFTLVGYSNKTNPNGIIDVPINRQITFKGESSNFTATQYKWEFDDGTENQTSSSPSVWHTFYEQGTYTVNLTATTGTFCDSSIQHGSKQIRVLAPPCGDFQNTTQRDGWAFCAPKDVSFKDLSTSDVTCGVPTSWQWNFGDNTDNATQADVTHRFNRAGVYTVTMTVSNIYGSSTVQKLEYVNISGNVNAGFSVDKQIGIAPLRVNFTDMSKGTVGVYTWVFGDNTPNSHESNPSHIYEKPGLYPAYLTVTSPCGNEHTSSKKYIAVNGNMTPICLFGNNTYPNSPNPVNGTPKLNVTFLADTGDGTLIDSIEWEFGDGTKSTKTRPAGSKNNLWTYISHNYTTVRDYSPMVTISNKTYKTDYGVYQDHIGVYKPLNVSFRISPSPPGVVGQEFTFTDTSPDNLTDWEWNFGDNTKPKNGSPIVKHIYNSSSTFPVVLTGWNKYDAGAWTSKQIVINSATNTSDLVFVPSSVSLINGSQNDRQLNILLKKADFGLHSFKLRIDLDSVDHAKIKNWYLPPTWVSDSSYTSSDSFRSMTITGMNKTWSWPAGSRDISLGNISLLGTSPGSDVLRFNTTNKAQIWYGSSKMEISGIPATITTSAVPALPPYQNQPKDLWPSIVHDGLLDDFDGNGVVNTNDVVVFFNAYAHGHLDGLTPTTFDYNRNGVIDPDDIVKYYNLIW